MCSELIFQETLNVHGRRIRTRVHSIPCIWSRKRTCVISLIVDERRLLNTHCTKLCQFSRCTLHDNLRRRHGLPARLKARAIKSECVAAERMNGRPASQAEEKTGANDRESGRPWAINDVAASLPTDSSLKRASEAAWPANAKLLLAQLA